MTVLHRLFMLRSYCSVAQVSNTKISASTIERSFRATRNSFLRFSSNSANEVDTEMKLESPSLSPVKWSDDASPTFVSSYVTRDTDEIVAYLKRRGIGYERKNNRFVLSSCPNCKTQANNASFLNRTTGHFMCSACRKSGSWYYFKKLNGDLDTESISSMTESAPIHSSSASTVLPNYHPASENKEVVEYLTKNKHLTPQVIEKYKVGYLKRQNSSGSIESFVVYPWLPQQDEASLTNQEKPSKIKYSSLKTSFSQVLPYQRNDDLSFFGLHLVPPKAKKVILTDDEISAMAAYQGTEIPSVSLPYGTSFISPSLVPLLEGVEEIYLWFRDDAAGREGIEKAIGKFGRSRCHIIHSRNGELTGPIDASEALWRGLDLKKYVEHAQPPTHGRILTFRDIEKEIFNHINDPASAGTPCYTFPSFNKILKGLRRGEVTVVTGPTGCGKTTLLSQLSMDFTYQGYNTLWGSFEVKNVHLIRRMMSQFFNLDIKSIRSDFSKFATEFAQLQMYFMKFYGSTDIDEIFDAMDFAVYRYDVGHIIIDNLQFMLSDQGRGYEKFETQDYAISRFRKYATMMNVHITIVIHPRKEESNSQLTTSSVSGTAKATQEADNVIIVQRGADFQFLDIRKNRFDGQLGVIPFKFIPETCRFIELTQAEIKADNRFLYNDALNIAVGFKDTPANTNYPEGRGNKPRGWS